MKTSFKLKEAKTFESAHMSATHFALFFLASRILRLFRMEWVDHLDRVGQVGAQCAHRQTFRSNFLPQLEEHPIPFANC